MIDIYSAGPQTNRVRFVMLLSLASAIGACWAGWNLSQTFGLNPGDGGVLAPVDVRLAWGLGVAGLGLAFAAAMWLYGRLYIRTIQFDRVAKLLHVRTLGMFGDRTIAFPATDVLRSTFLAGQLYNPFGVSVNAPWYNLWVSGRRWPFILDAQGVSSEPQLLERLLKSR